MLTKIISLDIFSLFGVKISIVIKYNKTKVFALSIIIIGMHKTVLSKKSLRLLKSKKQEEKSDNIAIRPNKP